MIHRRLIAIEILRQAPWHDLGEDRSMLFSGRSMLRGSPDGRDTLRCQDSFARMPTHNSHHAHGPLRPKIYTI